MALFVAYLLSNPNIGSNNSSTKQTAGKKVVEKRETLLNIMRRHINRYICPIHKNI